MTKRAIAARAARKYDQQRRQVHPHELNCQILFPHQHQPRPMIREQFPGLINQFITWRDAYVVRVVELPQR